MSKALAPVLLVLSGLALSLGVLAAPGLPPVPKGPIGQLSYVESDPLPAAAREGAGRGSLGQGIDQAFVEVLYIARWQAFQACLKTGRADCNATQPQHEWSVPFIPDQNSEKLEEALSRAWNRFDARVNWRLNSLINAFQDYGKVPYSYLGNCVTPAAAPLRIDLILDTWNAKPALMDPKEFCDQISLPSLPTHTPGLLCSMYTESAGAPVIFWNEVKRRYDEVMKHAMKVYYADYWRDVDDAINRYMPSSLDWDGVYDLDARYGNVPVGTTAGSTIQPVYAQKPQRAMYENLARAAQSLDPRGRDYILQRYDWASINRNNLAAKKGENLGPKTPGLPRLEALKTKLPKRTDILGTPLQWASPATVRPKGTKGIGMTWEYEAVGHATFLRAFARKDLEFSPRGVFLMVKCRPTPVSGLRTKLVRVSERQAGKYPVKFEKTRAHTGWMSVPEGYAIPNVLGLPVLRDVTESQGFDPNFARATTAATAAARSSQGTGANQGAGTAPRPPASPSSAPRATPQSSTTQKPATQGGAAANTNRARNGNPAPAAGSPLNWPLLGPGDHNCNVATVQYALRERGYPVALSGSFDEPTRRATQQFQQRSGLGQTGQVGPQTWERLFLSAKPGDTGNAVAALQYSLQALGLYTATVDGIFGPVTTAALKAFQTANGIDPNGVAWRYTWNALVNADCRRS